MCGRRSSPWLTISEISSPILPPNDPYGRAGGRALNIGDHLYSATRAFRLTLQSDGNLVLYVIDDPSLPVDITKGAYIRAIWASNTVNSNAQSWVMQGDGNLVVYNGAGATGTAVWASQTPLRPLVILVRSSGCKTTGTW